MNPARNTLLWMSGNQWMKNHVPRWKFVRRAVRRFMPGETVENALDAASDLEREGIPAVFTRLGENITQIEQAEQVRDHYLGAIDKIAERNLKTEISVKLTQLGFDISEEGTFRFCRNIAEKIQNTLGNELFIDMEGSAYVQRTIDLYRHLKSETGNVGLCVQAYLHRTTSDIDELFGFHASLRLVKGAYKEPAEIAIRSKSKVDENYFQLALKMLQQTKQYGTRIIYATHDEVLISRIIAESKKIGLQKEMLEFQMLYGIKTSFLRQLARDGYSVRVLIAYGESWYPWYVRRLAERPANVWFVVKNVFKT
jgi:proline dehydrogenase